MYDTNNHDAGRLTVEVDGVIVNTVGAGLCIGEVALMDGYALSFSGIYPEPTRSTVVAQEQQLSQLLPLVQSA